MSKLDIIQDFMAAYPHFNPPDPARTLRVYMNALSGYEEYELRAAFDYLMENGGNFFPTIPEISKTIKHMQPQAPRAKTPEGDFWQNMTNLRERLQGGRADVVLPEAPRTKYSDMDADELQRLADKKAGYYEF